MRKLLSGKVMSESSSRRRGSVVIIVYFSLVMLMGFCALAVDYGILNADANRLQRGCDVAALAGAGMLKKTTDDVDVPLAAQEAIRVAAQNNVVVTYTPNNPPSDITFPPGTAGAWSRIRVQSRFTRQLLFARFWGMNTAGLGRAATAELTYVTQVNKGFVPLVITTNDYNTYSNGANMTVSLIRMQSRTDFAPGTIIGIRTNPANNGKSPSHWADDVQNGTTDIVKILDNDVSINAALQNQSGRLDAALNARIADARVAGWNPGVNPTTADEIAAYGKYPSAAARRVFTIGVADPTAASTGNQNIVLLKFVQVYLVASDYGNVTLRLMPKAIVNTEGDYTIGGTTDTGLQVVRLIDDLG